MEGKAPFKQVVKNSLFKFFNNTLRVMVQKCFAHIKSEVKFDVTGLTKCQI